MSKLEIRSLFKKIFGNKKEKQGNYTQGLSKNHLYHTAWKGTLTDSDIVRSALRPITDSVGKLTPVHKRKGDIDPQPHLKRLLKRPNPYMSMQDFLSKMTYYREVYMNAFAYVKKDIFNRVEEIYPIPYNSIEMIDVEGEMFARFRFRTGKVMTIHYSELMHIRKDFYENDIFGDDVNNLTLKNILEILETTDKGVVKAIKSNGFLNWIMKFNTVIDPEDKKIQVNEFIATYLDIEKSAGVAAVDGRYELIPAEGNDKSFIPSDKQMEKATQRIYNYFGVNEKIVQNSYTEDDWNAFYSGKIEYIAIQFSDAFTNTIFTQKERDFGNEIICSANRLTFASNETKIKMAKELIPLGLLSTNQMLQIMELPPVENGDKRYQTLNIVDTDIVNEYQLGKIGKDKQTGKENINDDESDTKKDEPTTK